MLLCKINAYMEFSSTGDIISFDLSSLTWEKPRCLLARTKFLVVIFRFMPLVCKLCCLFLTLSTVQIDLFFFEMTADDILFPSLNCWVVVNFLVTFDYLFYLFKKYYIFIMIYLFHTLSTVQIDLFFLNDCADDILVPSLNWCCWFFS
jgi:hypothetical protein